MKTREQIIDKGITELMAQAEECDNDSDNPVSTTYADFLRSLCDFLEALK